MKLDAFAIHLEDIARHPMGPGDGTRESLILGHMALAVDIAGKFRRPAGVEFADLVQAGYLGLVRAATKYDPSRAKFSTYATYWIRQAIARYLSRSPWGAVSTPSHAAQLHNRRMRGLPIPEDKREFADAVARARKAAIPLGGPSPLGAEAGPIDLADPSAPDPGDPEGRWGALRRGIASAFAALPERERAVLELRLADDPWTLASIGDRLGLTKERVRQIELKALNRIRRALGLPPEARTRGRPEPPRAPVQIPAPLLTTAEASAILRLPPERFLELARELGLGPKRRGRGRGKGSGWAWPRAEIIGLAARRGDPLRRLQWEEDRAGRPLLTTAEAASACGLGPRQFLLRRPPGLSPAIRRPGVGTLWDPERIRAFAASSSPSRSEP